MRAGIFGLQGAGKTTLFKAMTGTVPGKSGIGVVRVPDNRIQILSDLFKPKKTTFAEIDFEDIGNPQKRGRSGVDSKYLEKLGKCDILVLTLGQFLEGNPVEDFHSVVDELILADLNMVENTLNRWTKEHRSNRELDALKRLVSTLEAEQPAFKAGLDEQQQALLQGIRLTTNRRLMVVVNVGEDQDVDVSGLQQEAASWEAPVLEVCAQIEAEIAEMDRASQAEFLEGLGIGEPAVRRVIKQAFNMMNLISFFTTGSDEVKAWPIRNGTVARKAAGKVHSDIERGFIRAEVISYDDFMAVKDMKLARDKGLLRLEGKDYVVKDGDIINFRFNV